MFSAGSLTHEQVIVITELMGIVDVIDLVETSSVDVLVKVAHPAGVYGDISTILVFFDGVSSVCGNDKLWKIIKQAGIKAWRVLGHADQIRSN